MHGQIRVFCPYFYQNTQDPAFLPKKEVIMDLFELKKHPHLSASSVNDYIDCGLLYKFGRIDKLQRELVLPEYIFLSQAYISLDNACSMFPVR